MGCKGLQGFQVGPETEKAGDRLCLVYTGQCLGEPALGSKPLLYLESGTLLLDLWDKSVRLAIVNLTIDMNIFKH